MSSNRNNFSSRARQTRKKIFCRLNPATLQSRFPRYHYMDLSALLSHMTEEQTIKRG
ncbi:hypothetical protein B932_0183 [Gluconobacter oxydans H24]|nr:hypothetical protein B932_0183 [Gluconobacter oxydans H24]